MLISSIHTTDPGITWAARLSEHYEPLYRFAMSLTRAEADAKDLT